MRLVALICALLASAVAALLVGTMPLALWSEALFISRALRIGAAIVVGASLSVSGVAMQALLRNPLADPFILGMSGGASLGAVLAILILPVGMFPAPFAAAGALLTAVLVTLIARDKFGLMSGMRLILAGVAVASVLASLTTLILQVAADSSTLRAALFWTSGSLGAASAPSLMICALLLLVGLFVLRKNATDLDRLLLGDEAALALGVPVKNHRRLLILLASSLTGLSVYIAGLIGFIGLVAPHIARLLVGPGHRALIPTSALLGALLLLWSDTAARTVLSPRELSVGILTAALGGPFFLGLLRNSSYGFGDTP